MVPRRSKQDFANDIAKSVGLPKPSVSRGSTVDSNFLRELLEQQTGQPSSGNTYEIAAALLEHFGLNYDPRWDTSEAAGNGGGTVTARTFSRLRSAILQEPRCFILNVSASSRGAVWQPDFEQGYAYSDSVTSAKRLNEAGPGSRVIFYSTANSRTNKKQFIAAAQISDIEHGWTGPWRAFFTDFHRFANPIPRDQVVIHGHNSQHAIVEINPDLYERLVGREEPSESWLLRASRQIESGTERSLARTLSDLPRGAMRVDIPAPDYAQISAVRPVRVEYQEDGDGVRPLRTQGWADARARDSTSNRLIEAAATSLVLASMDASGWSLVRDRQADGCGYDLEFHGHGRSVHVEVKGISSSVLAFNLTPKELWRAESDPDWVLMAVQDISRPAYTRITTLSRRQIAEASRAVLGYRVRLEPSSGKIEPRDAAITDEDR